MSSSSGYQLAFPPILTDRLILRVFDPSIPTDYDKLVGIYNAPYSLRVLQTNLGIDSPEGIDRRCAAERPRSKDEATPTPTHPVHLVYLRPSETFIGMIALWHRNAFPYPDLAYAFDEGHINQGYATEAAKAALAWWSNDMQVENIWLGTFESNKPSIRVAEKMGLVDGGRIKIILPGDVVKEGLIFVQKHMGKVLDGTTIDASKKREA
ncbi:hypothetical protein RBB50_002338 [Rhinocladiella similis]